MENALSIVKQDQPTRKTRGKSIRGWCERALREDELFKGTDEVGCSGWFVRLSITGLYPRRVGPFASKAEALAILEELLGEVVMGPLCEIGNTVRNPQDCVVEGIPRLAATTNER